MRTWRLVGALALLVVVGSSRAANEKPGIDELWDRLASTDEGRATHAALTLAARPKEAVALLGKHLRVVKVDKAKVAGWIEQLGDETFTRREEAMRELAHLGKFVKTELEKAAESKDAEVKKRSATLLSRIPADAKKAAKAPGLRGGNVQVMNINGQITIRIDGKVLDLTPPVPPKPDLDAMRTVRAIAILEHIGTPEARKILARLADGEADAIPTREAGAALKRLGR